MIYAKTAKAKEVQIMQRKATKQSPGADKSAKEHMQWIKERGICAACGVNCGFGRVICHHVVGSSRKVYVGLERVQIGNHFVIGLCWMCDDLVTRGTRKDLTNDAGMSQAEMWEAQYKDSPVKFDEIIIRGIMMSGY